MHLAYLIDHYGQVDEITVEQLMQFIQGPDFPTGGILYRYRDDAKAEENADAIAQGYSLGKSRLVIQAKAHFEEMSRGRMRIVITELPYQTNKQTLLERIADLVRDEKIGGITDLRDESDRTGMRMSDRVNTQCRSERHFVRPLQVHAHPADLWYANAGLGRWAAAHAAAQTHAATLCPASRRDHPAALGIRPQARLANVPTSWKVCCVRSTSWTK